MRSYYEAGDIDKAAAFAKDAAPYVHPRMAAIEVGGKEGAPPIEMREVSIVALARRIAFIFNQAARRRQTLWSIGEMNQSNELGDALVGRAGAMIRRWYRQSSPSLVSSGFLRAGRARARWRPRKMLRLPKRRMQSECRTILLLRFERQAT
jgi:hypothetical protein